MDRLLNQFKNSLSKIKYMKDKLHITSNTRFFLIFLAVRLTSVFFVQTWYVPDEYWQSLEVAHNMVFGYGHKTWEWTAGIRSYIPPLLIAIIYKLLALINFDTVNLLVSSLIIVCRKYNVFYFQVFMPRLCQAVLSAYADLKFYHWSGYHKWAAFNIICSWFWFYTGSRTLINTFETSISMIALSKFPFKGHEYSKL